MPFKPGQSGNPGGRKKSLGLSRAVRRSEGLKSWAWLCRAGDERVLERKELGEDKDGNPITVDVVPSVKVLLDVHKLKLAYCWGQPNQKMDLAEDFELSGTEDPLRLLTVVVNALLRGDIAAPTAGGIASLVATFMKVKEGGELEQRIAALEEKLNASAN